MSQTYRNSVVSITVPAGQSSAKVSQTVEAGFISRVVLAGKAPVNPGMVRAQVENAAGKRLVENQPIEILRSRDCEYERDGVPVRAHGGQLLHFEINATQPFEEDYTADFVLAYTTEEN